MPRQKNDTSDSSDVKKQLANQADAELHPAGEPERTADQTSYPVPNDAEVHDPPVRSTRPDAGIIQSLATGAGQHVPPSLDEYDEQGRPRS